MAHELEMSNIDVKFVKKQLSVVENLAETLSNVNLMTGSGVKMRIAAKSLALKFGYIDADEEFVPPQEVLLYLVR